LTAVLAGAVFGVLLSGFVSAIPLFVRGMTSIFGPLQIALLKGWYLVPLSLSERRALLRSEPAAAERT